MIQTYPTTLSFDDVLLVPKFSNISSRSEVSISSDLSDKQFKLPIISSPMDTVTSSAMLVAMHEAGGFGIVHRYNSIKEQSLLVDEARSHGASMVSAAVGVGEDLKERTKSLVSAGVFSLCVDVAHGHHSNVEAALKKIKDSFGESVVVIAGNVATAEAALDLEDWGADAIRIGVGGGSICSTRIQTGHGIPTFHSVRVCADRLKKATIIADGGIRNAGDIVKSLAAGADFVMLGSLLAGTTETPGDTFVNSEGERYKVYRGMASREAQIAWRGHASSLEGVSTTVPYKGSTSDVLADLAQNVKSGLSYSGAQTIKQLRSVSTFVRQTQSGQKESFTHILTK
ncbi:MAG: guanosine monophosphate reductase [Flavobacteriales bacterium TMED191]|nr:MAG: guanosine monophosphate reductase [Flavobacteriales bacterium TMED191]|tara:strand:+ start:2934 stop:3959 length:1026 start_codon:yes stop_codon:yes gene_type:complete